MSLINKEIADFEVQAYINTGTSETIRTITKSDVLGKWSIFFFYPADFTFVCPTELEDLAINYDSFRNEGAEVYSVSSDTEFVHKAWHEQSERIRQVRFPMLADPAHVLMRDFEILDEKAGIADRGTFIVNPQGRIQVYTVTAPGIGRNAEELLRLLQAAKFVDETGDQVCPAKWRPGSNALTPGLNLVGKL